MKLPSLLGHTSELLRIILKKGLVADLLASEYLRSRKYLGSNDRKFISELTFSILRNYNTVKHIQQKIIKSNILTAETGQNDENMIFFISFLGYWFVSFASGDNEHFDKSNYFEASQTEIIPLCERLGINHDRFDILIDSIVSELKELAEKKSEYLSSLILDKTSVEELSILFNMPSWIIERLTDSKRFTNSDIINLCESLTHPAKVHLRVNSLAFDIDEIIEILREFDPDCVKSAYSPLGIVLSKRINLNNIPLFKNGVVEVQDEGSQLISYAFDPQPGESILDACAGAGGKTIHIATLMSNTGQIAALDVETKKLKELKRRAANAGFTNIQTYRAEHFLKSNQVKFDRVLIDSPCSGLGTVRRSPMLKWTLTPEKLKKHSDKQQKILSDYSKCVRSGGILVYSTCSFMPEENYVIVEQFLENNPDFEPLPLKESFDKYYIVLYDLTDAASNIQLLPSIHKTDGFFIAKLRRK